MKHRHPKFPVATPGLQPRDPDSRFSALVESSLDALIVIDADARISDWNPQAERIFGYSRAMALGRNAAGLITPAHATDEQHKLFVRYLKQGQARTVGRRKEMTAVRANGGKFPAEITLTCSPKLVPATLIASIRDITERKHTESILRHSEERFRRLVESVRDYAIHLLDHRGRILTWNSGANWLDGYCPREIIGRRFHRLYTPEDVILGRPDQALASAAVDGRFNDEGWSVRKDGSRYWANVVFTALRDADGGLIGFSRIARACTQRREAEVGRTRPPAAQMLPVPPQPVEPQPVALPLPQPASP